MAPLTLMSLVLLASLTLAKPVAYAPNLMRPTHGSRNYGNNLLSNYGFSHASDKDVAEFTTTSCTTIIGPAPASASSTDSTLYFSWMTYPSSSWLPSTSTSLPTSSIVPTTQSSTPSTSQTSSPLSPSTCSAYGPPAPTQSNIVAGCSKWYVAEPGDFCYEVAQMFGISVDTFMAWNPAVVPPTCQSMLAGDAYCVATSATTSTVSTSYSYSTSTLSTTASISSSSSSIGSSTSPSGSYPTTLPTTLPPSDKYHTYLGDGSVADGWPSIDQWLNFTYLFNYNIANMKVSCQQYAVQDDTDEEVDEIRDSIWAVAALSGVDERFILAMMIQESTGCVRVITSQYSHDNPGLMQSYEGSGTCNTNHASCGIAGITCDSSTVQFPCPGSEIFQMILDGTNGTQYGDGLHQNFAEQNATGAQGYYRTARIYNGGGIDPSGDLGKGCCTVSYVSDSANRLMGWAYSPREYNY